MEVYPVKAEGLGLVTTTFFLAGTMAGSGVLALPLAMVGAGPFEVVLLLFFALTSAFVGVKLGQCWVMLEERFPELREQVRDPYPTIAEKAAGRPGRLAAIACINFCLYGAGCVFIILIAGFIKNIFNTFYYELSFGVWMVVVTVVLIPFCWLGTPNDFWPLAIGALVTTLTACSLVISMLFTEQFHTQSSHKSPTFIGLCQAFSSTMFAFAGAPNFPVIQCDMKDRRQFYKAVSIAMGVLLALYTPMAVVGYVKIGDALGSNIIESLSDGTVKIVVEIFLLLHLISAFPIVVNPPNQYFEGLLNIPAKFTWKRVLLRTVTVLALLFIAESLPSFGSILDLIGGCTVTPLTFVFPPYFYMRLVDFTAKNGLDQKFPIWNISKLERIFCWFIILIGVVGGVCSTVVAVINIAHANFKYPCYIKECV